MNDQKLLSNLSAYQKLDLFTLRKKLQVDFPNLSVSDLQLLSESIQLSNRLSEKAFPFQFWNLKTTVFEQATDFRLAKFHASLLKPFSGLILDGCGGAGFDGLAFYLEKINVLSTEIDPIHFHHLVSNKTLYELQNWNINHRNFLELNPENFSALYLDPMRRNSNSRFVKLEDYEPSIDEILKWLPDSKPVLIKVSPMLQISEQIKRNFQITYVGLNWECKEILLSKHFSNLRSENLFIYEESNIRFLNEESEHYTADSQQLTGTQFIYEPHPAILKSGFENQIFTSLNLRKVSKDTGYFFGKDTNVEHLAKKYYLIDSEYNKYSSLGTYLSENSQFNFVLKKKNSNIDIDKISRKLDWKKGNPERIIFISTANNESAFWVGEELKD